jgi:hypothetical protein
VADSVRGSCLCGGVTFEVELPFRRANHCHWLLDDDPQIRPQFHTYVASRAPWDELLDDGLPRYEAGKPGDL